MKVKNTAQPTLMLLIIVVENAHLYEPKTVTDIILASKLMPKKLTIVAPNANVTNISDHFVVLKKLMTFGDSTVKISSVLNATSSPTVILPRTKSNFDSTMKLIDLLDLGTNNLILIVFDGERHPVSPNIRINQQIYFTAGKTLTEMYSIGGKLVKTTIGKYVKDQGLHTTPNLKLTLSEDWSVDVGKRRSDFLGQRISAIVVPDPPYSYFDPNFDFTRAEKHTKDSSVQLHYVGDKSHASGLYVELFQSLAHRLNFSYDFIAHVHATRIPWGKLDENKNFYGLANFVANETVDVFAAGLSHIWMRQLHLNFLPGVGGKSPSIFIRNNLNEEISWFMYVRPFNGNLWIALFCLAVLIAINLHIVNSNRGGFQVLDEIIGIIITRWCSYRKD